MKNPLLCLLFLFLIASCKKGELVEQDLNEVDPEIGDVSRIALKNYFVVSIAFEKSGTAWLGTLNQGLIKYDGQTTTVFDSSNSIIKNAPIWDIEIDKAGNIWIGSEALFRYNGSNFTRYDSKLYNLPANAVRTIAIDSKDNIWFSGSSFKSGGLIKYDGKNFTSYTPENSKIPGSLIQSIAIDQKDNVWLAVNDGLSNVSLARFSGTQWDVHGSSEIGFQPYYFGNIAVNKNNDLIVAIDYGLSSLMVPGRPAIFKYNGSKSEILSLPDEKSIMYYTHQTFVDSNNQLWASFFGKDECGVFRNGKWILKNFKTDGIFAFGEKPNGEIWLGTGNGVYILK